MQTAEYPKYEQVQDEWKLTASIPAPVVRYGGDQRDRVKAKGTLQLNVFGMDARERVTSRLNGWYGLYRRRDKLKEQLDKDEAEYKELVERLQSDYPSITPVYDNMPRGTDISDSTGNFAARRVDIPAVLRERIVQKHTEIVSISMSIREIESAVAQLGEEGEQLIRLYFLEGRQWQMICTMIHMSKSEFYRTRDAALDLLADQL